MSTYKALQVFEPSNGYRTASKVVELPIPSATPGNVVVRNTYASVAAYDTLVFTNKFMFMGEQKLPFTAGLEAIGVVTQVGDDVESVKVGDSVTYTGAGAFAEYTLVPAAVVTLTPSSEADAMSYASAVWAEASLQEAGEIKSGETVFVTAAAGGTGQYVVQLAKKAGNTVIGMTSSEKKAEFLRELGCDRVINYSNEDVSQVLSNECPQGVDLIFDSVGGELLVSLVPHLAMHGRVIAFGITSEYSNMSGSGEKDSAKKTDASLSSLLLSLIARCASIRGISLTADPTPLTKHRPRVMELFAKGELKSGIDDVKFDGLASIPDALEYVMARKNIGKVVVKIQSLP